MKIETNFNIGETIYFLGEKKCCSSKIRKIKIDIEEEFHTPPVNEILPIPAGNLYVRKVTYLCSGEQISQVLLKVDEEDAFKSKESLLKSL